MTHPHLHNLTALSAVADFAREHALPLQTIAMPQTPFNRVDAIGVELPAGELLLQRWLDLFPTGHGMTTTAVDWDSVATGEHWRKTQIETTLPDSGVRVSITGRWSLDRATLEGEG